MSSPTLFYAEADVERASGIHEYRLAAALWDEKTFQADYLGTFRAVALRDGLKELKHQGLVREQTKSVFKPPRGGGGPAPNLLRTWISLARIEIDEEQKLLLKKVIELSETCEADYAFLKSVGSQQLLDELGSATSDRHLYAQVNDLADLTLLRWIPAGLEFSCRPTYAGMVRIQKRGMTAGVHLDRQARGRTGEI